MKLELLHLCDSLFPIGAFAYSDGLEAAPIVGARHVPGTWRATPDMPGTCLTPGAPGAGLGEWMSVVLDESIARLEGPAVWQAWRAVMDRDWDALASLGDDLDAIRPASAARAASRAMGHRLLTTWSALHPDERLAHLPPMCALPLAFAAACACTAVDRRTSVEAYAYTRLASTVSAAMRVLPLGQTEAHGVLARALDRVPAIVDAIASREAPIECFSPALDIAAMTQQYLHSRLFRS